jgi:hypothetical protein
MNEINLNPYKKEKKAYISKRLAIEHINNLFERVKIINNTDNKYEYPHKINNLIVFGSFLSNKKVLGDLDIAYDYKSRWQSWDDEEEYFHNKPYRNWWLLALFNSTNWTKKLLRDRKKSFSLHEMNEVKKFLKIPEFRHVYLIKDSIFNDKWQSEADLFFNQDSIIKIKLEKTKNYE